MDGFSPSVWSPVTPIERVTKWFAMVQAVKQMINHTNTIYGNLIIKSNSTNGYEVRTPESEGDEAPQAVTSRSCVFRTLLKIKSYDFNRYGEGTCVYVYRVAGQVAGLAKVTYIPDHYAYLDDIVSSPYFFDVAAVFCEYILDEAVTRKIPPVIKLAALDTASVAAYEAIGFISVSDKNNDMILNPQNQDEMWKNVEGKWKCIRAISKTSGVIPTKYRIGFEFGKKV
ncbi:unnamed protein product [Gemmata massiliana]|uniref:Uncharacterized protein n=1 Tax=Gemmata massiliana TaxID=1210884 RepID=A0A6P2CW72_9BACT|nr:hypothetical protein [Gemmata massiliana]VTR93231.1 unnamed protein product [Gemmata massiliana]